MHLTAHEITDVHLWEQFISSHCAVTFMQSWAWGEFEQSCGHEVYRFGVYDESHVLSAVVQAILLRSKRATFVFVPHGPILHSKWIQIGPDGSYEIKKDKVMPEVVSTIHKELFSYASKSRCSFIRINSTLPQSSEMLQMFESLSYRKAPIYLTSENAAVLPLAGKNPEELLMHMRKTTRYLIHKAAKAEVSVDVDQTGKMLKDFMSLYEVTTEREKFSGFSEEYIKREFEAFQKYDDATFLTAYHDQKPLASALILFTKRGAFYHQGASNHSPIPAPYALQWKAIQIAIDRGCEYYNFWGTYIPGRTPKGWKGLSLFKSGFGTHTVSYLHTMDFVLKPVYYLTYLYETYLNFKRGV